jgi:hypothetical protein
MMLKSRVECLLEKYDKVLHRYEDDSHSYERIAQITYKVYPVIKETAKTYFIKEWDYLDEVKRVRKEGKNLFAFDTKEKAMHNYKMRKERHIEILKRRLEGTEQRYRTICGLMNVEPRDIQVPLYRSYDLDPYY